MGGAHRNRRWHGEVKINEQRRHYIVCGWRLSLVVAATTNRQSQGGKEFIVGSGGRRDGI